MRKVLANSFVFLCVGSSSFYFHVRSPKGHIFALQSSSVEIIHYLLDHAVIPGCRCNAGWIRAGLCLYRVVVPCPAFGQIRSCADCQHDVLPDLYWSHSLRVCGSHSDAGMVRPLDSHCAFWGHDVADDLRPGATSR